MTDLQVGVPRVTVPSTEARVHAARTLYGTVRRFSERDNRPDADSAALIALVEQLEDIRGMLRVLVTRLAGDD